MDGPHVDAVILERASKAACPLVVAFWICSFHWSLGSTQTPSTLIDDSWTVAGWPLIRTVLARSPGGCRRRRVKWIIWYFSGANTAPWRLAHAIHRSWALVRRWQFSCAVFPQVIRL